MVYPSKTSEDRALTGKVLFDSLQPGGPKIDYQQFRNELVCEYMHDMNMRLASKVVVHPKLKERIKWRGDTIKWLNQVIADAKPEANSIEAGSQPASMDGGSRRDLLNSPEQDIW